MLGLNPYSSTSFRLASSAVFFCFLRLHKKSPANTNTATTTTGTTTATAVLPAGLKPFVVELLDPSFCNEAAAEELDAADEDDEVDEVGAATGVADPDEVITIVTGGSDDWPGWLADCVTTDVRIDVVAWAEATVDVTITLLDGSTVVVEGKIEEEIEADTESEKDEREEDCDAENDSLDEDEVVVTVRPVRWLIDGDVRLVSVCERDMLTYLWSST